MEEILLEEILLDDVDALWPQVEQAVDATPGIDPWCSGPDWTIPVTRGFAPHAERLLLATEDRSGFALFAQYHNPGEGLMLGGLEPLWGFAAPIVGQNIAALADSVAEWLRRRDDWQLLYLPGLPMFDPEQYQDTEPSAATTLQTASAMTSLGQVSLAEGITRQVADLSQGVDAWLTRRTPRFRRNLRQAAAKGDAAGLTFEDVSADPKLFDRLLEVERRSWKGVEGSGITTPEMTITYRLMIDRLRKRGRLHAHMARLNDQDVGYILGGIRARRYRGLQISYTDEANHLSVGNLLQFNQLQALVNRNLADTYDLGMDFDYKRRWADHAQTSLAIIVHRYR